METLLKNLKHVYHQEQIQQTNIKILKNVDDKVIVNT